MLRQEYQGKVAIVNSRPKGGGAATIASTLYKGFKETSKVEFFYGNENSLRKTIFKFIEKMINFFSKKQRGIIWSNGLFGEFNLSKRLNTFSIIHLNWINNSFISIDQIGKINKPIVWTLHDLWPLTGGCHIPYQCERFSKSCGECKYLGSSSPNDLSHKNFLKKKSTFSNKNIHWVAPSKFILERALLSPFINNNNISLIHNCIELDPYKNLDQKNKREVPVFLFGAMDWHCDPNKGASLLEECLWQLKESGFKFELKIFGSLKSHSFSDRLNCTNLGIVSKDNLPELLNSCDLFLLPSKFETFGLMSIEAQAAGTPVVAFKSHGVEDTISHLNTGYLANYDDCDDFLNGVKYCINNLENLNSSCKQWVQTNFSVEIMLKKYSDLYLNLVEKNEIQTFPN